MKKISLIAMAILMLPAALWAQITLSGTVTDKLTASPLPGATVKIKNAATVADKNGFYSLQISSAGIYKITVSYVGFQTAEQTLTINQSQQHHVALNPAAFKADEVLIQSTRVNDKMGTTFKNIDKATIEQANFGQDLPFIINNTPGVVATSDGGNGVGYTGIRIRGSDASRINVTLNGIPYNDSESQGTFWVNMPDFASSVESIQIQRGVGTSTNGAGAFGGSLNIQTSNLSEMPFAELNNTFGSFNTFKNTIKLGSGLLNNKFSFEGRLSQIKSNGYVDRAKSDLKSFFLSGAYQGANSLLQVNVFSGTETTYQAWNGVPLARLNNDALGMQEYIDRNYLSPTEATHLLTANGRTYNSFTYKDQTDNYKQNHYQLVYGTKISENFRFNGALHYTKGKGYYEEFKADQKLSKYGLNPVIVGNTTISKTDLVRRRWLDNNFYGLTYAFNYTPAKEFSITFGGAYNEYAGKHFGQVVYAKYGSNGDNQRHYYDNKGDKNDFNVYGKIEYIPVNNLRLFADLQYRSIAYKIIGIDKNRLGINVNDKQNFFNPKIGASYTLNINNSIYASYSIGNKEPNRDDYLNNQNNFPKSENLNDTEIGYRYSNQGTTIGVNGYHMQYKNQLVLTGKINDVGEAIRQNVPNSYRYGLELDAILPIDPKFAILLNAAISSNKIKNFVEYVDSYDNVEHAQINHNKTAISFSPNQIIGGALQFTASKNLSMAWQNKYVSKQFLDNTQNNSRKLNAYFVNDFKISYNLSFKAVKNIQLALLVNNIFDKKYENNGYAYGSLDAGTITYESFYFPQAGTNFLLNLNLKF